MSSASERTVPLLSLIVGIGIFLAWEGLIQQTPWVWYFGCGLLIGMGVMWLNESGVLPELQAIR